MDVKDERWISFHESRPSVEVVKGLLNETILQVQAIAENDKELGRANSMDKQIPVLLSAPLLALSSEYDF